MYQEVHTSITVTVVFSRGDPVVLDFSLVCVFFFWTQTTNWIHTFACITLHFDTRYPPTSQSLRPLWRTLWSKATCWSVTMFSCRLSQPLPPSTSPWPPCRRLYRYYSTAPHSRYITSLPGTVSHVLFIKATTVCIHHNFTDIFF